MNTDTLKHRLVPLTESGRFDAKLLAAFSNWIATAPDDALFRVNPIAYAAELKTSERDAIDLFVHATRAGLFDFAWGLICPSCGGFLNTPGGLRSLARTRQCRMCEIDAGECLDDGVEVCFTVNEAVRAIRFHGTWSSVVGAGPSKMNLELINDALRIYFSHAQPLGSGMLDFFRAGMAAINVVKRGEEQVIRFELDPARTGEWRLVAPAVHAIGHIVIDPEGTSSATVQIDDGIVVPGELRLKPGPVELRISHRTNAPEMLYGFFCLDFEAAASLTGGPPELPTFLDQAPAFLTGKRLLSTQSFRELFRTETLPSDGSLEIRALAMLFTDLKASTQLYERVGDLKALALVREHFGLLSAIVAEHDGAVVKTIGDAVMATFSDPLKAMTAALKMHAAIGTVQPEELQLKVGLHVGPCVAVDSNERVDYFGQTVNIAARVQALAEGREVVLTDSVLRSPGVAELLKKAAPGLVRESALLKGIELPMIVHRTTVG